ncbi:MAG: hypothetical protein MJB14_23600 [Spirochaetes bacterium]|nr:hypothetical protein [Spirochaetota bacterium]
MIIKSERDQFDDDMKIILYSKNQDGKCKPKESSLEIASEMNLGNTYYETREIELERLKKELLEGQISPIKLYIDYHAMDEKDVAARMRISYGKLKKFLTMEGFKSISVELLTRFAGLFNVSVVDFFQFIHLDKNIDFTINNYHQRIIQELSMTQSLKDK